MQPEADWIGRACDNKLTGTVQSSSNNAEDDLDLNSARDILEKARAMFDL